MDISDEDTQGNIVEDNFVLGAGTTCVAHEPVPVLSELFHL